MVTIRPIRTEEIEAAKHVITTACLEFFGQSPANFEDMEDIESQYSGAAGAFLVLIEDENVVGTGAIRRFDDCTCELKRMWFFKEYRGRGFGKRMALMLLEEARKKGYKKVRLDTSPQLEQAVGLYRKLGFHFIEPYNNGPATLFLEKQL